METHSWDIIPEKGETILWQGKPQRRCGVTPWWGFFAIASPFWTLLLWGLTGVVPQGMEGFYDWVTDPFCRAVMLIPAGVATAFPFCLARCTNGSSYVVTDRRIIIRKPWFGSHYREDYAYKSIYNASVKPMGEGLASFRFEGCGKGKHENSHELLFAIPATVAHDADVLFRRAHG